MNIILNFPTLDFLIRKMEEWEFQNFSYRSLLCFLHIMITSFLSTVIFFLFNINYCHLLRNVCITDDILGFSQKLSAYPSTTTTLGKKIEGFERVFFFYVKLKNLSFKIIPDII